LPPSISVKLRIAEVKQLTKSFSCEKRGVNIDPFAFLQEDNDEEYSTSEWYGEAPL
jgi:hypothetical protein